METRGDSSIGSRFSILVVGLMNLLVNFELMLSFLNEANAPTFFVGGFKPIGSFLATAVTSVLVFLISNPLLPELLKVYTGFFNPLFYEKLLLADCVLVSLGFAFVLMNGCGFLMPLSVRGAFKLEALVVWAPDLPDAILDYEVSFLEST